MAVLIAGASAQNSQVMYNMNLPQNHLGNPAFRPSNSLYIGLPVISGINFRMNNNFVNFSDILMKSPTGDPVISFLKSDKSIDDFLAKTGDRNYLEPQLTFQLFGLGFSVGKDAYFFLDINERVEGNVVLPGDLLELALKGNEKFVGSKIDLSSLRGDLKYYREIGLGFSKNFTDKLRVGVKGKLLFGIASLSVDNRSLGITVSDNYTHKLDADLIVNISAPVKVSVNSGHDIQSIVFDKDRFKTSSGIINFISGKNNMGLGLDIGAEYDISDRLKVSAAITDLGFIKWKKDITNLKAKSQFEFSGLNVVDVINGIKTFDELGNEMRDTLKNAFTVSDSKVPFTTNLPLAVTFGGSYNLTKSFSLGLLSYSRIISQQFRESLTLSGNLNLGNVLSTSLGYTFENHRYDNLGAGLAIRAGTCQFYVIADRIPLMWNKVKVDSNRKDNQGVEYTSHSTIPLPEVWDTINFRLGMNLVFGNRITKKADKPMILVE